MCCAWHGKPLPTRQRDDARWSRPYALAQGFGFAIMRRKGAFGNASNGRGFVVARLPSEGPGGEVCWSAPSFFTGHTTATGFPRGTRPG